MDPEIFWFEMSEYYSKKTDACGTIPADAFKHSQIKTYHERYTTGAGAGATTGCV